MATTAVTKDLMPLATQEVTAHGGFTHMAIITADDLNETTANTTQAISLSSIPIGAIIQKLEIRLQVPFQNTADPAYNTTTVIVGDVGSTNRFIASSELNLNGIEIVVPIFTNTAYGPLTAAEIILATFGSQSGKSLSNINKGELHVFVQILDPKPLSDAKGTSTIAK